MTDRNKKLKWGPREDYTDEQWAEAFAAKADVAPAEKRLRGANRLWRDLIHSPERLSPLAGASRVNELRHMRLTPAKPSRRL